MEYLTLAQMSLAGGVMILVTAVLRAFTINRLPKRTFTALWEIILLRLIIPFSIPSPISIYTIFSLGNSEPPAVSHEAFVSPTVHIFPAMPSVSHHAVSSGTAQSAVEGDSVPVWLIIWLAGAGLMLLWFSAAYLRAVGKYRYAVMIKDGYPAQWLKKQRIKRKVRLCFFKGITSPLTYGIIRPVILLPSDISLKDTEQLELILTHEMTHIKRFDTLKKLLAAMALSIHWFNPMVWLMYLLFNRDIELACDEAVVRATGGLRAQYARAIIGMEEKRSELATFSSHFSKNAIEERIVAIMKIKKTGAIASAAACALVIGVTGIFATSGTQSPEKSVERAESDILMVGTGDDAKISVDGGETFVDAGAYEQPEVEWWTYEGYKAWLEEEKIALQSMLGEKGWTGSLGDFVWTQEMIDETIAMYEENLEKIKNGMLLSKTVDGSEDIMLAGYPDNSETVYYKDDCISSAAMVAYSEWFTEYQKYGLIYDEEKDVLMYNGERVGYFKDEYQPGAYIRTIMEVTADNGIGIEVERDADYKIIGLKKVPIPDEGSEAAEYEATFTGAPEEAPEEYTNEQLLNMYGDFGISFDDNGDMLYNGETVRYFCDGVEVEDGCWTIKYCYLNDKGTVDVITEYQPTQNSDGSTDLSGKLVGLRKATKEEFDNKTFGFAVFDPGQLEQGTFVYQANSDEAADFPTLFCSAAYGSTTYAEGSETNQREWRTFPEIFAKYEKYGVTFEEDPDGRLGNVYYDGIIVRQFSDITPDGGTFTYTSGEDGSIDLKTVYDDKGQLRGVEARTIDNNYIFYTF